MVDTGTFTRLTADEQNEYQKYSMRFIKAVLHSDAVDGFDFQQKYHIQDIADGWILARPGSAEPFAGICCSGRAVIEALLIDAVQNYGR